MKWSEYYETLEGIIYQDQLKLNKMNTAMITVLKDKQNTKYESLKKQIAKIEDRVKVITEEKKIAQLKM